MSTPDLALRRLPGATGDHPAIAALALAFLAFALPARAQQPGFPQIMPPNTVFGRTAINPCPGQAIPFSIVLQNLSIQSTTWVAPQTLVGNPDLQRKLHRDQRRRDLFDGAHFRCASLGVAF
jgi:hypothetical protein